VTGAGSKVFRVPVLETALAENFSPGAVSEGSVAAEDLRSSGEMSGEYLAHLVTVMARRAVEACG
jgi:carbon-monoxide dehydrogenase medium subunit